MLHEMPTTATQRSLECDSCTWLGSLGAATYEKIIELKAQAANTGTAVTIQRSLCRCRWHFCLHHFVDVNTHSFFDLANSFFLLFGPFTLAKLGAQTAAKCPRRSGCLKRRDATQTGAS
jgi:hypothetical protein